MQELILRIFDYPCEVMGLVLEAEGRSCFDGCIVEHEDDQCPIEGDQGSPFQHHELHYYG